MTNEKTIMNPCAVVVIMLFLLSPFVASVGQRRGASTPPPAAPAPR